MSKEFMQACEEIVKQVIKEENLISEEETLEFMDVVKDNMVYRGITLKSKQYNCTPTMYLDDMVRDLSEDGDLAAQLRERTRNFVDILHSERMNIDTNPFFEKDYFLKNVTLRVVNAKNKDNLVKEDILVFPVMVDGVESAELIGYLSISVNIGLDEHTKGSIRLKASMLEVNGLTKEECYEAACENMKDLFETKSMAQVMCEIMGAECPEEMLEALEREDAKMDIVSTPDRFYGAACLAMPKDAFENIARKRDSDLVVLPSSIHEVIIIPYTVETNGNELRGMVSEINASCVGETDFLSNVVFLYRKDSGLLETLNY